MEYNIKKKYLKLDNFIFKTTYNNKSFKLKLKVIKLTSVMSIKKADT